MSYSQVKNELKDHLDIFNDPQRVFNTDETSVILHPKSRPVLATKGQKTVYDASGTCNKENITVLITGNAMGEIAPPLALVSYKKNPVRYSCHGQSRVVHRENRQWLDDLQKFF